MQKKTCSLIEMGIIAVLAAVEAAWFGMSLFKCAALATSATLTLQVASLWAEAVNRAADLLNSSLLSDTDN